MIEVTQGKAYASNHHHENPIRLRFFYVTR